MSLSSVLSDRGSKERDFILGCSPRLAASVGKTADKVSSSLGFAQLVQAPLLVKRERDVDATTIGTAFDYRVRFGLGDFAPWRTVARSGLDYLRAILNGNASFGLPPVPEHELNWPKRDEYAEHKHRVLQQAFDHAVVLLNGSSEEQDRAAILMAWCEQTFRTGTRALDRSLGDRLVGVFDGKELAASIDASWLRYLSAIRAAAQPQVDAWRTLIGEHRASVGYRLSTLHSALDRPYYLPNPGFPGASLVGGADGDWIIGDTLIDCKTDQAITTGSLREHLLQLIGYVLLDLDDWYKIRQVAIWYPCFGLLPSWSLETLLSGDADKLLPQLRADVRKTWGARQAIAVRRPIDQRRLGVLFAQSINTPFEMLAELAATTNDLLTLKHLANNRSTPIEVLRDLAKHSDPRVREQVAKNTVIPLDLLIPLLKDNRISVRRGALTNPRVPPQTLMAFAEDPRYMAAVAANPALPIERLLEMAKESRPGENEIRKAIAKNPSSTPDILRVLHYWNSNAALVLRRPEMTPDLLSYIYDRSGQPGIERLQDELRRMWDYQAIGQRARLHVLGEHKEPDPQKRLKLASYLADDFSIAEMASAFALPDAKRYAVRPAARIGTALDQKTLAGSQEAILRAFSAVHRDANADSLRSLASDPDPLVRAAAALNPRTPGELLDLLAQEEIAVAQEGLQSDVRQFLALNPVSSLGANVVALLERIEAEADVAGDVIAAAKRAEPRGIEAPVIQAERDAEAAERRVIEFDPHVEAANQQVLRHAAKAAEAAIIAAQAQLLSLKKRRVSGTEWTTAKSVLSAAHEAARLAQSEWRNSTSIVALRSEARRLRKQATALRSAYERNDAFLAPYIRRASNAVYKRHAAEREFAESLLHAELLSPVGAEFLLEIAKSRATAPEILTAIADSRIDSNRISLCAALNEAIDFSRKAELIESAYGRGGGCGCFYGWFDSAPSVCNQQLSLSVVRFNGTSTDILRRFARRCAHEAVREEAARELAHRGKEEMARSTTPELLISTAADLVEQALSEDVGQRVTVARHPELTPDVMIRMASDKRWEVRASLAKNPSAPTEILDFLGGEKSVNVRRAVASHPKARPELLAQLAQENDFEIHWRLALNTGTPPALLARLAADSAPEIAVSAMLNPSTRRSALEEIGVGDDQLLGQLAGALTARVWASDDDPAD